MKISRANFLHWAAFFLGIVLAMPSVGDDEEWTHYGGDAGGQRYSRLAEIDAKNVGRLELAWAYESGDVSAGDEQVPSTSAYELTPIYIDETLFGCTPMNRVFALDPVTGAERWRFDPKIDLEVRYANQLVCRGVAYWSGLGSGSGSEAGASDASGESDTRCTTRIFTATNDARLIALDARTGERCEDFGRGGDVALAGDVGSLRWRANTR